MAKGTSRETGLIEKISIFLFFGSIIFSFIIMILMVV